MTINRRFSNSIRGLRIGFGPNARLPKSPREAVERIANGERTYYFGTNRIQCNGMRNRSVTDVAALLRSYFPKLSLNQIKEEISNFMYFHCWSFICPNIKRLVIGQVYSKEIRERHKSYDKIGLLASQNTPLKQMLEYQFLCS